MILDYYRIFYYVAQYKSFSKAAEVMGNNQPNITRCMNILENEHAFITMCPSPWSSLWPEKMNF